MDERFSNENGFVMIYDYKGKYTVEWKIIGFSSDFREIEDKDEAMALFEEYKSELQDEITNRWG